MAGSATVDAWTWGEFVRTRHLSVQQSRLFQPSSIAQSLGIYLPSAAAYRLLGLARGILLAWLMSEREFGLFQLAILGVSLLFPVVWRWFKRSGCPVCAAL